MELTEEEGNSEPSADEEFFLCRCRCSDSLISQVQPSESSKRRKLCSCFTNTVYIPEIFFYMGDVFGFLCLKLMISQLIDCTMIVYMYTCMYLSIPRLAAGDAALQLPSFPLFAALRLFL